MIIMIYHIPGAWSKTMIGDNSNEQESFSLELTYNYGINSYIHGNALRYIAMRRDRFKGDTSMIVKSEDGKHNFLRTVDGYEILLVDVPESLSTLSAILFISLHVTDIQESIDFYTTALKAKVIPEDSDQFPIGALKSRGDGSIGKNAGSVVFRFDNDKYEEHKGQDSVYIELVELSKDIELTRGEAFGRLAIETEDNAAMEISEAMSQYKPSGRGNELNNLH